MSDFSKISYFDLRLEALYQRLPEVLGFEQETARLTRVLARELQHNAIICAPSGSGKTALVMAWAKAAAKDKAFAGKKIVLLNASGLQKIGQLPPSSLPTFQEAFASLADCVLIIDSFGEMIYQSLNALQNWNTLIKPLFFKPDINVVLCLQPEELSWLKDNKSHFLSHFEILKLEPQDRQIQMDILKLNLAKFSKDAKIEDGVLEKILSFCKRFTALGQLPKSAIALLDEAITSAKATNSGLTGQLIEKIVAEKTGIPLERLAKDDKAMLKNLPTALKEKIIGQDRGVDKIVSVIQRARLGLRNQARPLGSFLLLGPSGVGKTETAKILAETLYGSTTNFLRIDMSEFGESHSTARLLGSPAGYIGFESGGQLTNHFQNYPYSLLLLDEIEKANPKIFDIFLQILDDGRVTSAKGDTVDFSQSVIMATSNLAVQSILEEAGSGRDVYDAGFIKQTVIPELLKSFRMEFLNRFDEIIIFKPLSLDDLADIALLEIGKIESRMKEHGIKFTVTRQALRTRLSGLADPRFGARPVKRFVEETCENLITQKLLN